MCSCVHVCMLIRDAVGAALARRDRLTGLALLCALPFGSECDTQR